MLQQQLSAINLYRYEIDGIVGAHLVRAVAAFQKQSGLTVTGFPDHETLFWLCQQGHKEGIWPKA